MINNRLAFFHRGLGYCFNAYILAVGLKLNSTLN